MDRDAVKRIVEQAVARGLARRGTDSRKLNYCGWESGSAKGDPGMLKRKKHTPEQIIGILRRIEQGETADAVCRDVNINEATLYRWKQQYGTLELDELRELKALREKNARLKQVVAHQALHIQVLKEVNEKNGESVAETLRGPERGGGGLVFAAPGGPLPRAGTFDVGVSGAAADAEPRPDRYWHHAPVAGPFPVLLSPRACPAVARRLGLRPTHPDAKVKADGVNDMGCVDLVFDTTQRGPTARFLTIVDEGSYDRLDIVASCRHGERDGIATLQASSGKVCVVEAGDCDSSYHQPQP